MSSLTPRPNSCICLVKTDEAVAQRASLDLKDAGYTTVLIPELRKGLRQISTIQPVMIVLDRNQAGEEGFKFCRRLRNSGSRVPVIFFVEQETVAERVACLEAGADDYLLKPYRSETFLERIGFYLQPTESPREQLQFGELILDLTTRRAFLKEKGIDFTMKEFELLKYLMSNPEEVLSREQILENVWGYDFRGESNVIEVYVRYLRLKLETEGQKRLIHTVRGVGYILREA